MTTPRDKNDIQQLLDELESLWRGKYSAEEINHYLNKLLMMLKQVLKENRHDAKLVSETYLRLATGEMLSEEEIEAADHALIELLKYLGITVIWILPGSMISLPVLVTLARHFNIDLVPKLPPSDSR